MRVPPSLEGKKKTKECSMTTYTTSLIHFSVTVVLVKMGTRDDRRARRVGVQLCPRVRPVVRPHLHDLQKVHDRRQNGPCQPS